ncbi:MAG: hypothetical protein Q8N46_01595, partial [Anaerolineales bacterium]|nr:hypothetical protein [Anaerolineales bacterium]
MRSRIFLIIGLLVLIMGACNPATPPTNLEEPPITNMPTPLAVATDMPTPLAVVTNMPLPTPPDLPVGSSPTLIHIAFLDANNGWGISANDGGYLLRTVDGGTTWLNATPPGVTGIGYSTNLSVLDVNTVWVL